MSALLGMLTAIGGGMTRDVLLSEIRHVLRSDLYAVVVLAAASIIVIGNMLEQAVRTVSQACWISAACPLSEVTKSSVPQAANSVSQA